MFEWLFKVKFIVTKFLFQSASLEPLLGFENNFWYFITFLWSYFPVENNCFHPVKYGGRHDCFCLQKHPSIFYCICYLFLHVPQLSWIQTKKQENINIFSRVCGHAHDDGDSEPQPDRAGFPVPWLPAVRHERDVLLYLPTVWPRRK